jgi:hypothetical protein
VTAAGPFTEDSPTAGANQCCDSADRLYPGRVSETANVHEVTLQQRGTFLIPLCSCGWIGTARSKLASAREEARDHALLFSSSDVSGLMLPELEEFIDLEATDLEGPDPDAPPEAAGSDQDA